MIGIEAVAALVDIGELHRLADADRAGVRRFLAGDQLEQRRLAGAVGADHADNAVGGQLEGEVLEQHPVSERLFEAIGFQHEVAEARAGRDLDLGEGLGLPRIFLRCDHFLVRGETRLRLGLTGLGARSHPFEFAGHGALAGFAFALLLHDALGLLLQPAGVVALVGDALAAVELQRPLGHLIKEVAVVGDEDDAARELLQVMLQPGDAFGVKVVGRLVQQEHVGLGQKQAGQRDTALFTP